MAWLPHSIAEASTEAPAGGDVGLPAAWSHLMQQLNAAARIVESDAASRNRVDLAAGMRHLLVLLATGIDEALRFDPDPILRVQRASTNDILTWGMECPDCLYTRATMRGGESYRLSGNRGTARYVGLQTMNGIVSAAECFGQRADSHQAATATTEVVFVDEHDGNWMPGRRCHSSTDRSALLLRLGR